MWTYGASVYYSFITISTVGYGDLYAKTNDGRIAVIAYSIVGFMAFGLFIATFVGPLFNFLDMVFDIINWPIVEILKKVTGLQEKNIQKLNLNPLIKSLFIINFMLIYILISAAIISRLEGWDYSTSRIFHSNF